MCGIVGVIGNKDATEILIQGLEKLEYRGYDSAGIYVTDVKNQQYLVKTKGRIDDLKNKLPKDIQGTKGIGHTRWATHGKPTCINAHPHKSNDGRFFLVHNGVIENYLEIKDRYLSDVQLKSDTDTEIVVQLISKLIADKMLTVKEGFKQALKIIKGSYAFALIDNEEEDVIYVAKNKSPLLIGLGDGFNVICSDAMAMIQETNQFVEIADGEIVTVWKNRIAIENDLGENVQREAFEAQISVEDLAMGTYPHYMLKEIDEQPSIMRKIVQKYSTKEKEIEVDHEIVQAISNSDRIYIVACGTSWHAGWIGKQLLEEYTNIPVEVQLSSEFGYHMPLLSKRPFFIFLSQSGETADSRQVLVRINELNHPSLTITNVAGSTLSREATYTMLLHAGPEIAVASTKAYTAQIAVLAILAKTVGMSKGQKKAQEFEVKQELALVANAMDVLIDEKQLLENVVASSLEETRNAFYIGRGVDYYVSMEAALKLKEISYIQCEGFAAGELKHGTIALIEEGVPVFGIITDEKTSAHTRGNIQEVASRGANTVIISMEGLDKAQDDIVLPKVHPLLTSLVSVIPAQLIAYFATLHRGYDVDKPRNLAKSVTVE